MQKPIIFSNFVLCDSFAIFGDLPGIRAPLGASPRTPG